MWSSCLTHWAMRREGHSWTAFKSTCTIPRPHSSSWFWGQSCPQPHSWSSLDQSIMQDMLPSLAARWAGSALTGKLDRNGGSSPIAVICVILGLESDGVCRVGDYLVYLWVVLCGSWGPKPWGIHSRKSGVFCSCHLYTPVPRGDSHLSKVL